jgi:cytochrome b561
MFKNTPTSYGLIAIILHWLMAFTVFGFLAWAYTWLS